MDKRYIEALQNLAYSLVDLVDEMKKKSEVDDKETSSAFGLFKGYAKLGNTLKIISKGINQLRESNDKILANQNTLLAMSKEVRDAKEKKNIFGRLSDKKDSNKLKDGVKTIVLIAAGITAIGLAFKLIGGVDFASVMALSLALPLIAYAFVEIAKQKELSGKEIFKIFGILVGISATILVSSILLSMVVPLSIPQMLTAIGIAAAFTVISFSIGKLAKSLDKVSLKSLLTLPITMVAIAAAITASSYILGYTQPIDSTTMMSIIMTSLALGAASVIMFIPILLYSKIPLKDVIVGSIGVIAVSGAIFISSLLLNMGNYTNVPTIDWALGAGLSLLLFSPAVILLGLIAASGVGAIALLLGGIAVIGLAYVISTVSHIMASGNYANGPSLDWALGTGLVMTTFGLASMGLGALILGTFGLGGLAIAAGNKAIIDIASTIVSTSFILAKGQYKGGPTKQWAEGISLALGAFSPVYSTLMKSQILSIFGGNAMTGQQYADVMTTIANSIIQVAKIFNAAGVSVWSNAPTKQWAEGVGLAIGSFAPVYSMMDESLGDKLMSLFFGKEDKAQKMSDAMITIAGAIIAVAGIFNKSTAKYTSGPSRQWAEGVGQSLAHFSTVYAMLDDTGLDYKDIKEMQPSILFIADAMGKVAMKLNGVEFKGSIPADYTENLAKNIQAFLEISEDLEDSSFNFIEIYKTANALVTLASAYDKLAMSLNKLNKNVMNLQQNQLDSLRMVTGNIISLSIIDSENFDKILDKLSEKSEDLKDLFKDLSIEYAGIASTSTSKISTTGNKLATSISTTTNTNQDMAIKDLYSKLEEMNQKLGIIASNSGNLSSYVNELRASGDVVLKH